RFDKDFDEQSVSKTNILQWKKLCWDFRCTFARSMFDGDSERHCQVQFVCLWDTVSSVGWVAKPAKFPFTATNPSVSTIRHAVSIDERRAFFRQNLFHRATTKQDLVEIWFLGSHCD